MTFQNSVHIQGSHDGLTALPHIEWGIHQSECVFLRHPQWYEPPALSRHETPCKSMPHALVEHRVLVPFLLSTHNKFSNGLCANKWSWRRLIERQQTNRTASTTEEKEKKKKHSLHARQPHTHMHIIWSGNLACLQMRRPPNNAKTLCVRGFSVFSSSYFVCVRIIFFYYYFYSRICFARRRNAAKQIIMITLQFGEHVRERERESSGALSANTFLG